MSRPLSPTTKFVLSLPLDTPTDEVLAKAKSAGVPTSRGNVYQVRRMHGKRTTTGSVGAPGTPASAAKPRNGSGTGGTKSGLDKAPPSKRPSVSTKPVATATSDGERAFCSLAIDLGLLRSRSLLDEVEKKLRALIDG